MTAHLSPSSGESRTFEPSEVFRIYAPHELGADGYPFKWHHIDGRRTPGVKDLVRENAGQRCERCGHPYLVGRMFGEWSRCDERCTHAGPCRARVTSDRPWEERQADAEDMAVALANGNEIEAHWRILTVHHLTGVKADLRWWNLTALCQRCHLTIQGRVQMERVWPWEHSEWFRPYAAGWYAFAYLDEDIARDEATARMDELLSLERLA